MKLYHGSSHLFEVRPDSTFREGFSNSEFGVGFNTTNYGADAWEYANGPRGGPGVIYEYEFDEKRLSKWIVWGQPLGETLFQSITDNLHRLPSHRADDIREELKPGMDGRDVFALINCRERSACQFLVQCGIEGSQCDNYYVFFSSQFVPPARIQDVIGDFPAAKAALERQKETGVFRVDQPVKSDGSPSAPRRQYLSEELKNAAHDIYALGDAKLIKSFEDLSGILLSEDWTRSGGAGFSIRNNLGSSFQRLIRDGGDDLRDHWSGINSLTRTVDWMNTLNGTEPIITHAEQIAAMIKSRTKGARDPSNAPA